MFHFVTVFILSTVLLTSQVGLANGFCQNLFELSSTHTPPEKDPKLTSHLKKETFYTSFLHPIKRLKRFLSIQEVQTLNHLLNQPKIADFQFKIVRDDGTFKKFRGLRIQYPSQNGLAKGGIRFHPRVDASEVKALSLGMSLKSNLFNLPFGGGKGGVAFQPNKYSKKEIEQISRTYISTLLNNYKNFIGPFKDVPAPDVGTNPQIMRIMLDEFLTWSLINKPENFRNSNLPSLETITVNKTHRLKKISKNNSQTVSEANFQKLLSDMTKQLEQYPHKRTFDTPLLNTYLQFTRDHPHYRSIVPGFITGKSVNELGLPGREEATGYGAITMAGLFAKRYRLNNNSQKPLQNLTSAIQGFGNVGSYTALNFHKKGGKVVHITEYNKSSDTFLILENKSGINIQKLFSWVNAEGRPIETYSEPHLKKIFLPKDKALQKFLSQSVDFLIPAALEKQITSKNAHQVRAKIILEAANGPVTSQADVILYKKGIHILPDILTNSGGIIASMLEWRQNIQLPREEYYNRNFVRNEIETRMEKTFNKVFELSKVYNISLREASLLHSLKKWVANEHQNQ